MSELTGFITVAATVAVAVFTFFTWRVYVQMARIMRMGEERDWMPLLELRRSGGGTGAGRHWTTFRLRNVGRGHALEVSARYLYSTAAVDLLIGGDLAPQEDVDLKVEHGDAVDVFASKERYIQVEYEDVFGNRFCVTRTSLGMSYNLYLRRL